MPVGWRAAGSLWPSLFTVFKVRVMRQRVRSFIVATAAVVALLGCQSDDAPQDGTTAVPEPSGATEEAPSNATEAAPETEAAPGS